MTMMMIDDGDRSREDIPNFINIFSKAISKVSIVDPSFVHFHTESLKQRPLSYFQADRKPGDDSLLQLCDKDPADPWIKQLVNDSELGLVQDAIKEGVVWLLRFHLADSFCLNVEKLSKAVDHLEFYNAAITAAAAFVYSFFPQHLLFRLGKRQLLERQMNHLWHQFTLWWHKGLSFYEVCKLLVHEIRKDKYSFISQYDTGLLLSYYCDQCHDGTLLYPDPLYDCSDIEEDDEEQTCCDEEEDDEEETDAIFDDIKKVVNKMGPFHIAKNDDYTRLLIKNFRGDAVTENETSPNIFEPSFADDLKTVYNTNFQNSCWLPYLSKEGLSQDDIIYSFECGLGNLSKNLMKLLQGHLLYAFEPLFQLCDSKSLELSPEVSEVIQVAEIRRIALESRFISQMHLMWAFYECGYGLPDNLKATISSDDEEHPPYHIYVASVKLAMSFGEKVVQLQHFVFAILRWDLIGDGEEVSGMVEDFKVFMKDLDGIKKTKATSEGIIENDVEGTGRDDVSYKFMEKNKRRRIETTEPELGPGGAMSSDFY